MPTTPSRIRDRMPRRRGAPWRIPLAALRPSLDAGWEGAHWSIDAEQIPGRSLVQLPGRVRFPVRLDRGVGLLGVVRLVPHDWLDGSGVARARIVAEAGARRLTLWSAELASAAALGAPDGAPFLVRVPAWCNDLALEVEQLRVRDGRAVGRVMWVEPALLDHGMRDGGFPAVRPAAGGRRPDPPGPAERPLFSVLTPVHDPPVAMLHEAIDSVLAQSWSDWELCLVDDGSANPAVHVALHRYAASDPRIRLVRRERAGGISDATNAALALARGEFVVLLDHDDTLMPDALERVARAIESSPETDMVYSDEAVVTDGRRIAWSHKPAWSPDNLRALMYTCHVGVYRRSVAEAVGGFRSEFDGCQDYDFVLRFVEHTARVAHVPEILYHWRAHANSTAGGDQAKPYAYVAQPRAIAGHLARSGVEADVQFGPHPGLHRIVYSVPADLEVTIVLGVADATGLSEAARTWVEQPHPRWNVALAAPADRLGACLDALVAAGVAAERVSTAAGAAGAGAAALLATAAEHASGDQLVLMSAPLSGLTHDWLRRLAGYSAQRGIAAAGPVVLSSSGRIRDAGAVLPDGLLLHLLHGLPASAASPVAMNVSAVGTVLTTTAATLRGVGGLDPSWGELTLVDFCLRADTRGLRTVNVPDVRMRVTGHDDTVNDMARLRRLRSRRRPPSGEDPHYNPHFRSDRADFSRRET